MRVLRPAGAELDQRFGAGADWSRSLRCRRRSPPRLAELRRLSAPPFSLVLAARADGVIVGLFDGEETMRDRRSLAAGEVAGGTGESPLCVSIVSELPPC